jgi:hypothetical protein
LEEIMQIIFELWVGLKEIGEDGDNFAEARRLSYKALCFSKETKRSKTKRKEVFPNEFTAMLVGVPRRKQKCAILVSNIERYLSRKHKSVPAEIWIDVDSKKCVVRSC